MILILKTPWISLTNREKAEIIGKIHVPLPFVHSCQERGDHLKALLGM
jgi:hypothetical protein